MACQALDIKRGFCVQVLSGNSGYVDDTNLIYDPVSKKRYTWFDLQPLMVSIPYYDYARLKTWIITSCKQSGQCDKQISNWERTLTNIDNVIETKKGFQNQP